MPYKNRAPFEKMSRGYLPRAELSGFKRKFLSLLCDSDSWSWDFKVEFFAL